VYLAEPKLVPGGLVAIKVIEKPSLIRKKTPDEDDAGNPEPEIEVSGFVRLQKIGITPTCV
jgi:hypothetical protein